MILWHGSENIITKPSLSAAKGNNDYGPGFYCTSEFDMACEWACKNNKNGFANKYKFNTNKLKVLDLFDGNYNVLNWMALLLSNRRFSLNTEIAENAKAYILKNFLVDLNGVDFIIGYRADDSYFSFAESFIENGLSLQSLEKALYLGKLGIQIALISEKAFKRLTFVDAKEADKNIYYSRFNARDNNARNEYRNNIRNSKSFKKDIFVMDILREEMKNSDERIQRIIFK